MKTSIALLNRIAAYELGWPNRRRPVTPEIRAARRQFAWLKKHRSETGDSMTAALAAWHQFHGRAAFKSSPSLAPSTSSLAAELRNQNRAA